jgi:hypothetical protein
MIGILMSAKHRASSEIISPRVITVFSNLLLTCLFQFRYFFNPFASFRVVQVHQFIVGPVNSAAEVGYLPVDPF